MSVRLAIGATVASLASLGLLVAYFYRKCLFECLGDIFGCAPKKKTHAVTELKDVEKAGASNIATAQGTVIGAAASRTGPTPAAPMIVVAADDAGRGEIMSYEALQDACLNWNAGSIIGKGAAATVYKGSLPRYGSVAVKRFHLDPAGGMPYNFDRELEALCQCRHPHILEILGRSQTGPEQLIVMPLMDGGTLTAALPSMTWAQRAVCFGQIVRAVSFLHGKKMVHRDIKSSNILMDGALRHARLADFGLAKDQVKGSRTHGTTGLVVGSPGYMAPELMMRPANDKTDAFALGVVALEVLTGLPAWNEDREIVALNDYAVANNTLQVALVDARASWPAKEVEALGAHAVKLTFFDPSQRQKVTDMEESNSFQEHVQRAEQELR